MMEVNKRIWNWFDNDKICSAILGQGAFFIPDVTYRDRHDRLLVIRQLIYWVNNEESKQKKAVDCFNTILIELSTEGEISTAADIVWSYFISIDELGQKLPIDIFFVKKTIDQMILAKGKLLSQNKELRELIMTLEARLCEDDGR